MDDDGQLVIPNQGSKWPDFHSAIQIRPPQILGTNVELVNTNRSSLSTRAIDTIKLKYWSHGIVHKAKFFICNSVRGVGRAGPCGDSGRTSAAACGHCWPVSL